MSICGVRIKELRKEREWSQSELGNILSSISDDKAKKIPASTISGYESGYRQPDMQTLFCLAKIFQVSVDYLTGYSDIRYPTSKISGDDFVDMLASKFATIAKPRIDRAKKIDSLISTQAKLSEKDIEAGISLYHCALADSVVFCYLNFAIEKMGHDIDSCLDNSSMWLNTDDEGNVSFNEDRAASFLGNDYLKHILENESEKVDSCQEQPKTPEQSDTDQTDSGKPE